MQIHKLSPLLINQIAAGEVIERPASVVKELVENSIDAHATHIDVLVEDGGRELIRISDDGQGIPQTQLQLAIQPHTTSKIQHADDLAAIITLGFRGEALASIASISRLRITSRTHDADNEGAQLEAQGDDVSPTQPASAAPGTIIEVRNLFFNTPARRKFMRTANTEFSHITETLSRIAMAHPDIAFSLTHNNRKSLNLPQDQSPRRRCVEILGNDLDEALVGFNSNEKDVAIWGLAGQPAIARATARHQYIFLNGRPIKDKTISHALKEAYRGLIEPSRHPLLVIFIETDPATVDINVHPTKGEVRFANTNLIHSQVLATIRQHLLATDLTPTITIQQPPDATPIPSQPSITLDSLAGSSYSPSPTTTANPLPTTTSPSSPHPATPYTDDTTAPSDPISSFVNYFKRLAPQQKGFAYQQVKREMEQADPNSDDPSDTPSHTDPSFTPTLTPSKKPILQIHDSYIISQDEQGIVIIDQHALHERMIFEILLKRVTSKGSIESQRLLTPITINVSPTQITTLQQLAPLLKKIGIDAQQLSPTAIAIHAFPSLLFDRNVDPENFITELLDKAQQDNINPDSEAALHEVLDMMSCKAAVKAGDNLADEELAELLKRKDDFTRTSACPHGRPTTIRLTLADLQKHFKRT